MRHAVAKMTMNSALDDHAIIDMDEIR